MPDAPSPLLNLNLQGTGDNNNTWGEIANNDFVKLEDAITGDGGYAGGTGSGIPLSGTTGTVTSTFGLPDQASQLLWPFTGALLADCTVTIPASVKIGWALNATTGGHSVILTTGVAGGTNLVLPATPTGSWTAFYCDGKDVTIFPMTLGTVTATALSVPATGWSTGIQAPWFQSTTFDAGGANFRAVGGNYGAFIRNDGSSTYLLLTNSGAQYGSFNSLRPFAISNATGAVSLDATGAGTNVGGVLQIGSSGQFYLNPNNAGNRLLNFAASNYIQWVSGTGLQINSTGGAVAVSGNALTFNGNQVAYQGSSPTFANLSATGNLGVTGNSVINGFGQVNGDSQINGHLHVLGGFSFSGTGAFIDSAGGTLTPSAWSATIGIQADQGMMSPGFFTNSDRKLKTDIEDIGADEAIGWIKRGRPRRFKWLSGKRPTAGFIAQEEIENDRDGGSIIKSPEDGMLSKDYDSEVAMLTRALQAALARIEVLEAKLA